MSEEYARYKQYEYKTNSNLVLTSENRTSHNNEPTGEVESLWGKLSGKMGDKANYAKPKELEEKLDKMRKKRSRKEKDTEAPTKKKKAASVLQSVDTEGAYRPKTKETRAAYEQLLSFIKSCFGDQPQDVLRGAADEVLAILKNENMRAPDKKVEIEKVLVPISQDRFSDLTSIGKMISDYSDEAPTAAADTLDADLGVAVVFDSDNEDDSDFEIREGDSDDDLDDEQDGELEATNGETLQSTEAMEDTVTSTAQTDLDPREIDAFWLQRKISAFENDPDASQALAEKVLTILQSPDSRYIENELVPLLDYERFDFVKLLVRNRKKITFCTRLGKAQSDEERKQIEAEMQGDVETEKILATLRYSKSKGGKGEPAALKKESKAAKIKIEAAGTNAVVGGKTAKGVLDLESLSFAQGGHLMSNKQCKLPDGSMRKQKKGYEEIFVPGLKPPAFQQNEKLIPVTEMPKWAQGAFAGMSTLNRVQSRLYQTAFFSADNFLLCAPTGAGKTNVAMLAFLHEIGLNMDENGVINKDNFKIIYIAPMKSLVQEMVNNFSQRLSSYGIVVRELTGDQALTKKQISETQIIVTTPEKWDIITRKSGERTYTSLVKLIVIDEIHLLHDDRGPVLESIVSRSLRQIEATQVMIRLVGLSATLPNYDDVGTFLRVKPEHVFTFDNSYRPVPLEQQYIGISEKKALKRFQLMNEITYEKVVERAGQCQILIFVHSRKETIKTARAIRDMALANDTLGKFLPENSASREILQSEADSISSLDLKEILPYGFAVHHAGMTRADRSLVEDLFSDKHIQVLVSTATLAWGVNLPAHTVIIKGTQIYNPEKGRWTELSPLDIMQMLGRAGRPAFDKEGEGIVITSHSELQFYLSLNNMQLPIESQFIGKLADHLNAEIVLGTVQNVRDAVNWIGYTYLYICMLRTPPLYGISIDEYEGDKLLEQRRLDLVHTAATLLDKNSLIKYDRKSGNFQVTDLGRVSSHYYISYQSMAIFNEHLKPSIGDIEIFRLFSLSTEFKFITVREEEKQEMEKLLERVPIPIKESIEEPSAKVNVLLQAYISRFKLEGFALISDMVYITQSAARIMRALFEIALKRGWAQLAVKLLTICKMVERRMWSSQTPLRQFRDIPEDILKRLEKKDFPMERLHDLNSHEIGELINFPQQGKPIYHHVHQFPRVDLAAHVQPITRAVLRVELTLTPEFQFTDKYHGSSIGWWILIEDVDS